MTPSYPTRRCSDLILARVEISGCEIGPQRTQQCIITLRLLLQQKVPVIAALDRSIRLEPTGQRCLRGWTIMHRQARRPSQRAFPPWRRRNARSTNRPTLDRLDEGTAKRRPPPPSRTLSGTRRPPILSTKASTP